MDERGVEELAGEYDHEGEYKRAEVLHWQSLAFDTLVSVISLAGSLEKQR